MVSKGTQGGGCCCGGCHSKPYDPALPTTAFQPVTAKCCSCIPKAICITADVPGEDTLYRASFSACEGAYDTEGEPILYTGSFEMFGQDGTIVIRFVINDEDDYCYLKYEYDALGVSDTILIDHADPSLTECDGRHSKQCCEFEFSFDVPATAYGPAFTLAIQPSPVIVVSQNTKCSGCSCLCRDACFGVYTRTSEDFTYRGDSEIVTGLLTEISAPGCNGGPTQVYGTDIIWERTDGWIVKVPGVIELPVSDHTVNSGTEETPVCSIAKLLWSSDGNTHSFTGGDSSVTYDFSANDQVGIMVKWQGLMHDENAVVEFFAWNWDTEEWDSLGTETGREDTATIVKAVQFPLESYHTDDDGQIQIKIETDGASEIHHDMLRILLDRCCVLELVPPYGVEMTYASHPFRRSLEYPNGCPNPAFYWEFTDGTTDYLINWGCSWCGDQCGSTVGGCCNRPIPRVLAADITMGCTSCPEVTVMLFEDAGSGNIWNGTAEHCGGTLTVVLTCGGDGVFHILVTGLGGCSFDEDCDTVVCNPIQLEWSGNFDNGIGCCGGTETPPSTSTGILITVTE